ncbi:hypothetical protein HOK51_09530 [Candidatus Woesearchaeota archaeon]|jgi:hypothetical protein|nr:hypothetical protein [Candidatus Woesearchaeota archaeon]MBT6520063.1 hypothetical protein [Candidatus Woesearchaeota archaeon]MBT7366668.1 hypothetical protein [Candidatus Woesearchaeota archaeon]
MNKQKKECAKREFNFLGEQNYLIDDVVNKDKDLFNVVDLNSDLSQMNYSSSCAYEDYALMYEPAGTCRRKGRTFFVDSNDSTCLLEGILLRANYKPFTKNEFYSAIELNKYVDQLESWQKRITCKLTNENNKIVFFEDLTNYLKHLFFEKTDSFFGQSYTLPDKIQKQLDLVVGLNLINSYLIYNLKNERKQVEIYRRVNTGELFEKNNSARQKHIQDCYNYCKLDKKCKQNKKRSIGSGSSNLNDILFKYDALLWKTSNIFKNVLELGVDIENRLHEEKIMYETGNVEFSNFENIDLLDKHIVYQIKLMKSTSNGLVKLRPFYIDENFKQQVINYGTENSIKVLNMVCTKNK